MPNLTRRRLIQSSLALAAAASVHPAFAAHPARLLEGAKLKADIAILRRAFLTLHSGIYRYATPAEFNARLNQLEADWSRDQSLAQAYTSLSRFLGTIKCGHTYANFYNQSKAAEQALFTQIPRLPFFFRWIDGQMVVTKNQSTDTRLVPGTIITLINGIRTEAILKRLMPFARADGNNDAKRRTLLEVRGEEDWESFDIYFALLYPEMKSYWLDLVWPDGRKGKADVASISLEQRLAGANAAVKLGPNDPVWTMRFDGLVATLTMPNWVMYNSKWNWTGWLDAQFAEMERRGITALIMDLRGNEGGNDCGNEVIARLIDQRFSIPNIDRKVRFRSAPADLIPYLDTWDRDFDHIGEGAEDMGDGWYRLTDSESQIIDPKGPRFRGKFIVLTEPVNSSATFQFARIVKQQRFGTLIGDTTGGNQRGINGGFYFLRLPYSGLEADLAFIGYFPRGPQPDAGIDPDIRVVPTARDIAAGRDPVMECALAAARG